LLKRSDSSSSSSNNDTPLRKVGNVCLRLVKILLTPCIRLMRVKLPVYVIFLASIGLLLVSQFFIIYSNHSIFMKLNDVIDAIHPMQTMLVDSDNLVTFSTEAADLTKGLDMPETGDNVEAKEGLVVGDDDPLDPFGIQHNGVFFSNTSYDYRECTSPESDVPWPLEGDVQSRTSNHTCGFEADTPFASFFQGDLWKRKFEPLTSKCKKLVVFGVAFGGNFVKDLDAPHVRSLINTTDLLERHGRCFFILTTDQDIENNHHIVNRYNSKERSFIDPVVIGHNVLIPLPGGILPYKNPRRNVKLLKYVGQYMFPEAETVIWQDAKFFRDDFVSKQPLDYGQMVDEDSCVTTIGLPVHKITVGLDNIRRGIQTYGKYTAQYEHHCQTIISALADRPDVTDSSENLIQQCDAYLQHVYQQEGSISILNQGLIDSAFIVWNHKTEKCRDFGKTLRCTIADQIGCHADRDQVSIPFAMYKMGVKGRYREREEEELRKVDRNWDPRLHDLEFVDKDDEDIEEDQQVMLRVTRSSCHWYFSRLGNCRTDLTEENPTMALLIAGSAKRYILSGMTEHLVEPLIDQNVNLDFYLMLSVKQGLAYRSSDQYMKHQTFDPLFTEIAAEKDSGTVTAYLFSKIRNTISQSGANVGGIHIQPQPMKLDPKKLRQKQIEAKKARPKEDSYFRFPTLDLRPEFRRRTAVTNRNLFKLYLGLQKLWEKHLMASETYVGVRYDYVMILRDDVKWLADFDLLQLINTNPDADAYVLSCDQRDPPTIANEYIDYGIVVKRSKASVIGRYFNELLDPMTEACHENVKPMVPPMTGCNNGMLLYHILQRKGIVVQKVPQSVFPIERTYHLKVNNTDTLCIHNMCQSAEAPLKIPHNLQTCDRIQLPG